MKNKELISVIVPVYNVEQYLSRCVDSILNQSYQELELILVNDGSKDKSLEVCRKYEQKDFRIKIVDKKNEGAGAARNAGLEMAEGELIMFIDSDDWIEHDMLQHLYKLLRENSADISMCNYFIESVDGSERTSHPFPIQDEPSITNDIAQCVAMLDEQCKFPYLWNRLYKRKFIEDFHIRFENQFTTGQDLDFNLKYFRHVNKCVISNRPLYHYIKNGIGSLCARYKDGLYGIVSELNLRRKALYTELNMNEKDDYIQIYEKTYVEYISSCVPNMFRENAPLKNKDRIVQMRQLFEDENLKKYNANYHPGYSIGKLFKKMVAIGNPTLAVGVYSILFWIRNNHSNLYQRLKK